MRRLRFAVVSLGVVLATAAFAAAATADQKEGFRTDVAPMLDCAACDRNVPILTVGEDIPGTSYQFEAIPDGISVFSGVGQGAGSQGRDFDLYVNHETSTVPFPFTFPGSADAHRNQNDYDNSQVSRLTVGQDLEVTQPEMVITSSEGYQRFCSNYLATRAEGFTRPILFTNEEAIDWVKRTGKAWPADMGASDARQAGVVVAYDVLNHQRTPIWGMGRHNHENTVAVPGYDELVVLSGDDSFVTATEQSQVYAYIAKNTNSLLQDRGDLYAFKADGATSYFDVDPGEVVTGRFIKVTDKEIATGRDADTGEDLIAADKEFAPPPANTAQWQAYPFVPGTPKPGVDGPQWVLESWGDSQGVFQFLRIEDIAYDKRPGMSNVLYLADSGRGNASAPNGRIWKMVLDTNDPTIVRSLTILVGDPPTSAGALNDPTKIHQPDNLETTANGSLLIQEDPGSSNQGTNAARIWKLNLTAPIVAGANPTVVASVNQSQDDDPPDVTPPDPVPLPAGVTPLSPGRLGSWESSGIVDASSVLGPGWFFVTIQAHTLWVEKDTGEDNFTATGPGQDGVPDWTFKREGGQLIAIRIPGA